MKAKRNSILHQESEIKKHSEITEVLNQILSLLKEISKNTFPGH